MRVIIGWIIFILVNDYLYYVRGLTFDSFENVIKVVGALLPILLGIIICVAKDINELNKR